MMPYQRIPIFRPFVHVERMLRDPRVEIALSYLKGSVLSLSRFFVDEDDEEIKEYLVSQINRWWVTSATKQLTSLEWGYAGCEVLYKVLDDRIQFDNTKPFYATDIEAVTQDASFCGIRIQRGFNHTDGSGSNEAKFIGGPKALWHVYRRERHPWYGQSRLLPAYPPWVEMTSEGGARDIRRLYFYKHAFQGETVYHPPGKTMTETGTPKLNKDIAREIVEHKRSGGVYALPSVFDANSGNRAWEIDHGGDAGGAAMDVLQYPEELRKEIAEGIGVPTELIEAAETGSGYSGRKVPQTAFRGMLSDMVYWLIHDFNEQVLIPLVRMNFDVAEPTHEVIPFGLVRGEDEADEGGIITQEGQQIPEDNINDTSERAQFSVAV
jgi:hypothetical protein